MSIRQKPLLIGLKGGMMSFRVAANVFALGAVAEFGAKNFQPTTKADARYTLELTTKTAIEPNAC